MLELDKQNTLKGQDVAAIEDIVRSIVKPGILCAEVGSWKGHSASIICEIIKPYNGELYCVDYWKSLDPAFKKESGERDVFHIFRNNMIELGYWDTIQVMYMKSVDAANVVKDNTFDMVFIDADHRYEFVLEDIKAWYPKVKVGGILCGHDYYDPEHPGLGHVGVTEAIRDTIADDVEVLAAIGRNTNRLALSCVWKHTKKGELCLS